MMKRIIQIAALCLVPVVSQSASQVPLMDAQANIDDKASLQRGARTFVNYCLGCHSMDYMRYNRMGQDIGLSDNLVEGNLMFASDKVGDTMDIAMTREQGEQWFGVAPPDLTVIARSRGADWLYSYLVTFYRDTNPSRPFGVNNFVFPNVAMPHVLWQLQGIQSLVQAERPANVESTHVEGMSPTDTGFAIDVAVHTEGGDVVRLVDRLEVTAEGSMHPAEFRKAMRDLVNFLVYAGEPAQLVRYQIGFWVLIFLAVLFVISRALYKEYWKDVH